MAVQLPGRVMRSAEPFLTSAQQLATELLPIVASRLQDTPYVVSRLHCYHTGWAACALLCAWLPLLPPHAATSKRGMYMYQTLHDIQLRSCSITNALYTCICCHLQSRWAAGTLLPVLVLLKTITNFKHTATSCCVCAKHCFQKASCDEPLGKMASHNVCTLGQSRGGWLV